jgi:tetratricopeptide (TPR) repeat protein
MKAFRYILTLALFTAVNSVFGQDLTARAHALYQAKDYDSAKVWIDSAVVSREKTNSQTWQLHGLIYRKLETPATPGYREVAINSFLEARKLDTANIYKTQITDYLNNTIIRYYNDAVNQLNEGKYSESERSYVTYKDKYKQHINPAENFDARDIEYYNALGGGYTKQLPQLSGKDHDIVFTLAISALGKVLEVDSMNYLANLNTAVLYYNKGADLIVNQDPFADIEVLLQNLEISEELFKKALPMMLKAYKINPESIEVIEGLGRNLLWPER